jgi:hypothetical protein
LLTERNTLNNQETQHAIDSAYEISKADRGLGPVIEQILTWPEIKVLLAIALRPVIKAQAVCQESDCCSFGQSRGSCPCSMDEDAQIAADLLNASNKAEHAQQRQQRQALKALQN